MKTSLTRLGGARAPSMKSSTASHIPRVRHGCAKVLTDLSGASPEALYHHMDLFVDLLDSKYRVKWNTIATIANLSRVDECSKFESAFGKYYGLLGDGYMVTAANVVSHSARIASAKPHLIPRIVCELLSLGAADNPPPHWGVQEGDS